MTHILKEVYCFEKKSTFTWKIHEFFKLFDLFHSHRISSQDFSLGNVTYRLEAYMSKYNMYHRYESMFRIDVFVDDSGEQEEEKITNRQKILYSIGLVDREGKYEHYAEGWVPEPFSLTNIFAISIQELTFYKERLVPEDIMTIRFEVVHHCFTQKSAPFTKRGDDYDSLLNSLSEDMGKLLKEPCVDDFVIRVEGEEIPVHSVILKARSPVFKAMLSNGYKEEQTNIVEIQDISKLAMCNFLEYVYAGRLTEPKSMSMDLLMEVYAAADKYDFGTLKDMCFELLLDKLSEDNMEKYVDMADQHNDQKMLDSVADFVVKKREVKRSGREVGEEKWKRLAEKVPTFGFRVLSALDKMLKKRSGK